MSDIDELIGRLEVASEGSRELDVRIHIAVVNPDVLLDPGSVGPTKRDAVWGKFPTDKIDGWEDYGGLAVHVGAPHYTTSLDAALTLVPDGMSADLHIGPRAIFNDATVWKPAVGCDEQNRRTTHFEPFEARAARDGTLHWNSPALALCIAALKARKAAAT